ncbi:S8 family peptidase [Ferrimonas pelagia]|uniref:S8 family serine peptidase n=1 Tax=Ferrimonas pelagia TaxID=1177826 RepID=A0ABP9EXM8_9GAMM
MKIKQLALATSAALYAAGLAASGQAGPQVTVHGDLAIKPINISAEQAEGLKELSQLRMNGGRGHIAGPNQMIGRGVDKVPFHFEADLDDGEHTYIVQLTEAPAATYQGTVPGIAGTASTSRTGLNVASSNAVAYTQHLLNRQARVHSEISRVTGNSNALLNQYKYAFNGMAMKLSQQQASKVAALAGVRAVTRSTVLELHTDVGPSHVGADQLWNGEASNGMAYTGKGMIVGIFDTGINSGHPSFAASGDDKVAIQNPWGTGVFTGDCLIEEFAGLCNDKLIGIHSYSEITDSYSDPIFQVDNPWAYEWLPQRPANGEDYNGHGSHTASTVAGNVLFNVPYQLPEVGYGDDITGRDTDLVFPRVSGMAPHANIISYQVCWAGGPEDPYSGCPETVTLQAMDDAIADGVHVINYSIGGGERLPWQSPTELAFLAAREAGISVAASAGNFGGSMRDHVSPWVTSVAATTHGRELAANEKTLDGFSGGEESPSPWGPMRAKSITKGYSGPVVSAADYGDMSNGNCDLPFAEATFNFLPDGITPLTEAPIVVCGRSDQSRIAKAENVQAGGAGGFILYNTQSDYLYGDSLAQKVDDYYPLPAAHIGNYDGQKVLEWLAAGSDHRVTLSDGSLYTVMGEADILANFSSRGPSFNNPHSMMPNLAAPGVSIFAAFANDRLFTLDGAGMNWSMLDGTSMASPHVAGAMALLQQAHPEWTPAQIQSALMTTTTQITVRQNDDPAFTLSADFDDAGSGVINVARAVKASLLMDETIDNYIDANPLAGGDVRRLNTPYMVDRECPGTCNWYRTFTAAEDGTWEITGEEVSHTGASQLKLAFTPSSFTLAAGESQRVMISATVPEIYTQTDDPSTDTYNSIGLPFYGNMILTPADSMAPVQKVPVIAAHAARGLPEQVNATIGRDQGQIITPEFVTKESSSLSATGYAQTDAFYDAFMLREATEFVWEMEGAVPSTESEVGYRFFEVPEGTKRLVVEIAREGNFYRYATALDLGYDANNNGLIDYNSEALCISDWRMHDYCAINAPEPGTYWYAVGTYKFGAWGPDKYWDPDNFANPVDVNVAIIGGEASNALSVATPGASNGIDPLALSIDWDLPDQAEGEIFHGVIELGTDSVNGDDIGLIPVRFERGEADVQLHASHTGAKIGDIVHFSFSQAANLLGGDRDINVEITLPEGLTLLEDSISTNEYATEMTQVNGNGLTINGMQHSSKDDVRRYDYTTSLTDEMCRLPFSSEPQFVDLYDYGYPALPGFGNAFQQSFEIPDFDGYRKYYPHIPLYGVRAEDTDNIVTIRGDGLLKFDAHTLYSLPGYTMGMGGLRDLVIAPFWRADAVTLNESGTDWSDPFTPVNWETGVFAADINFGDYLIVQWKGMHGSIPGGWFPEVDYSQTFNFELVASSSIDFTPGSYEIFFAYQQIEGEKGEHTIGLKGYEGVRGLYHPVNDYQYNDYAINEPEKFDQDMVVCANYQGPESTALEVNFSAKVGNALVASTGNVAVTADATGAQSISLQVPVSVAGSLSVFDMDAQTMDENTTLSGLTVQYQQDGSRAVALEVSGDNITAEVDGMSFAITPDAHWHGETEVMVTVFDVANPQDRASTSFMLTVNSDGVEPPVVEPPAEKKKDSGSLGYLALLILALAGTRRRMH